jgi:hypothetical protein
MECPHCGGGGCGLCQDGVVWVNECPQPHIAPVIGALKMIAMAEKGHLPVGGGVLDQSQWFMEAYRCFTDDVAQIKAESNEH